MGRPGVDQRHEMPEEQVQSSARRANILLVDDRYDKQLALASSLEELGHEIVKASSGSEALRILLRQEFAVILLDVSMPGMDGFETAALIRQRPKLERTPIIFITSVNTNETHVSRGYSLGAVDYIFSPIEPEILRAKVSVFLDLYEKNLQVKEQAELLRKEAESRAANIELRLQALLNRLNVGAFSLSMEGKLLETNPAFLRLFKVQNWEEIQNCDFQRLIQQIGVAGLRDGIGAENGEGDFEITRGDNTKSWVSVNLSSYKQGDTNFIEGLMEDISDRKHAEQSLAQSARLKDEFLAMLAHELRNPLAPIRNAVEIMKLRSVQDEHVEHARHIIERQVTNITRLVDDLLDVSRITQGKIALKTTPVALKNIVGRALETSGPLLKQRNQQVRVIEATEGAVVAGDETRLTQVLSNLLNNAAKYTPEGGDVSVTIDAKEGCATISVEDSGIGVDPEMLPNIFELFVQVDRSLDRSQGGLGIGLTLVRTIVELHGGTIDARSPGLGKGSEFIVRLPLLDKKELSVEPTAELKKLNLQPANLNILVVDDNVDSAETLAMFLKLRGNSLHVAHNGMSALTLAESEFIDLAFLDIGLPEMDGYEVAKRIRPVSKNKNMQLVAITGYGQSEDIKKAHNAGFDKHFTKPVDFDALEALLISAEKK